MPALSDRVAVMYEGRIVATVDPRTATREEIGLLIAGAAPGPESSASGG